MEPCSSKYPVMKTQVHQPFLARMTRLLNRRTLLMALAIMGLVSQAKGQPLASPTSARITPYGPVSTGGSAYAQRLMGSFLGGDASAVLRYLGTPDVAKWVSFRENEGTWVYLIDSPISGGKMFPKSDPITGEFYNSVTFTVRNRRIIKAGLN